MKRGIIYGRTSTSKQSAESVETQIDECKKWAQDNNCKIVDIYDDSGQSGRAYNVGNRTGFQQIKQDAKMGRMDFAIIHKIDRFARSVKDYFAQETTLEEYGVKIIVVGAPFLNDADIVTKSVHVAIAEQFSKNLSDEVAVKMKTFARKGAFLGGKPPYGFRVVNTPDGGKTLAIDEEKAVAIRMCYENYLKGYGYIQLSRILAENGFLNPKNEPFTATHIRKMLMSKKYNGWYVWGIRETIKGKEQVTWNKDKMVEIPNVYPKIINDELWEAVERKMTDKAPRNKRKSRHYPLTGKITCSICGRSVVGYSTIKPERNNKEYIYYRCNGKKVNGCTLPSVRAEFLERYIVEQVKSYVFNEENSAALISAIENNLAGDIAEFRTIEAKLSKELAEVNTQIKEATKDKYAKKISSDLYEEIVEELNASQSSLEIRLSNIRRQISIDDKSHDIRTYLKHIKNNLSEDAEVRNAILHEVVQAITITPQRIDIYIHLTTPPDHKKKYLGKNALEFGASLFEVGQSNVDMGVPWCTMDRQKEIFVGNGMTLLKISAGTVEAFNRYFLHH